MEAAGTSKKQQILATLAVLIVIVVIVAGVAFSQRDSDGKNNTTGSANGSTMTGNDATTEQVQVPGNDSGVMYKDGNYTVIGGYDSPGGAEEITVSVSLENGVITDSTVEKGATGSGTAEFYQEDFISEFKDLVVGKRIDDLKLSRVAGASLTTGGFNNAINQIRNNAVQS